MLALLLHRCLFLSEWWCCWCCLLFYRWLFECWKQGSGVPTTMLWPTSKTLKMKTLSQRLVLSLTAPVPLPACLSLSLHLCFCLTLLLSVSVSLCLSLCVCLSVSHFLSISFSLSFFFSVSVCVSPSVCPPTPSLPEDIVVVILGNCQGQRARNT